MIFKLWVKKLKKPPVTVDVLTGYAEWAKNYPAHAHNPLMQAEEQAMLTLLPENLTGKVCLDLACGSGRYLRLMQARQATQLYGTDYSPDMLAHGDNSPPVAATGGRPFAIYHLWPPQVAGHSPLVQSAFLALPFAAQTFDFITCGLAVGHEKNLRQTIAEMARVLRLGGGVIYSDFHPFGALSGWQRSFTTNGGKTLRLEHYLHLYADHQRACQAAGLAITAVLEPLAGPNVPAGFENFPLVLVIHAVKTGNRLPEV